MSTEVPVQNVGGTLVWNPADATNDNHYRNDGFTVVLLQNVGATLRHAKFPALQVCDEKTLHSPIVALPPGAQLVRAGPFPRRFNDPATGTVFLTWLDENQADLANGAGLGVAALRLKRNVPAPAEFVPLTGDLTVTGTPTTIPHTNPGETPVFYQPSAEMDFDNRGTEVIVVQNGQGAQIRCRALAQFLCSDGHLHHEEFAIPASQMGILPPIHQSTHGWKAQLLLVDDGGTKLADLTNLSIAIPRVTTAPS